ncbi:hypothetical protein JCM5805K_1277 [Lactococcus lactis subsp. lactis]|uniref:Uncharacterized protein n=1 Tax=Lactococcus lactis subsp. lactis TaxID=1360 RepID=A0A0B8QNJ0_LACLL|nr:hypothetical protein JCM5805K_1277 [Lactococcus lactis subsp. lactis]
MTELSAPLTILLAIHKMLALVANERENYQFH